MNVGEKTALVGHIGSGSCGGDARDVDSASCLLAYMVRVAYTLVLNWDIFCVHTPWCAANITRRASGSLAR